MASSAASRATILHADLDAFYASVEQLLDPSLRGKAIAVGGGVVLAASYEAKVRGVRAGMAGWRARQLCPKLTFVGGHFRHYQRLGDEVIEVLRDFTPRVERVSIDEAFLDISGALHLFGPPAEIAAQIRRRVREEIGLPISVGAARTKHLAKIASQVAKPNGLVVVDPEREIEFLGPLRVGLVWGVGPATQARLAGVGIHTIGQLAEAPMSSLQGILGEVLGAKLGSLAANLDPRRVAPTRPARSVGAQAALGRRPATAEVVRGTFAYLADRVAGRLRVAGRGGRTVTVRLRFAGMRSITRSLTPGSPVATTLTLTEVATELALAALDEYPQEREITLLAVSVSNLVPLPPVQLEFPLGSDDADERWRLGTPKGVARLAVDGSLDAIRDRFGRSAVGYAAVVLSDEDHVPDAFRELAEHRDLVEYDA